MMLRHLLLFILLSGLLPAQENVQKVATSVFAFAEAPGLSTIYVRTAPDAYQPLELSTANIVGPTATVVTEGFITLHTLGTDAEGNETHPLVAKAKLPSGLTRALVVLLPDGKEGKLPYRALVINHDTAKFPLGTYRIINLSAFPIRGVVGKTIVQAKAGTIANLKPVGKPGTVQAARFEYFSNERWNVLTETRCAIRDDRRWLMCVYQDPRSKRMNIRSIPDRTVQIQATRP